MVDNTGRSHTASLTLTLTLTFTLTLTLTLTQVTGYKLGRHDRTLAHSELGSSRLLRVTLADEEVLLPTLTLALTLTSTLLCVILADKEVLLTDLPSPSVTMVRTTPKPGTVRRPPQAQ